MKEVILYCDGACSGNPGPGGWGAILFYQGSEKELAGFAPETTNNRMELLACIEGLRALKQPCKVDVYSDSAYLCNAFNQGWLANWQRRGWKTSDGKPVENQDLWRLMAIVVKKHEVEFIKVPGHADCEENNRCDALARAEIDKFRKINPDAAPQT